MNTHPFRNVNNQLYIRIVIVICSPRYLVPISSKLKPIPYSLVGITTNLNILIRHTYVIRIGLQVRALR